MSELGVDADGESDAPSQVSWWRRSIRQVLPYGSGALLSPATRRRLMLAVAGSVVLAAAEVLGLLGIAVLLQILTSGPFTSGPLTRMVSITGVQNPSTLIVVFAVVVLVCFVGKGVGAIFFRRWMVTFMARQEAETATALLASYLHAPFAMHQRRSTADLMRTMYEGTSAAYSLVITALVAMVPDVLTIVAIVAVLVIATPVVAIGSIAFLLLSGLLMQRIIRSRADHVGRELNEATERAYAMTLQSLGGVREIKVRRNADYFLERFAHQRLRQAQGRATTVFLGEVPRYALELIFIFSVVVVTVLAVLTSDTRQQSLTAVGLFVAAGFRLLPTLVRVVGATTSIRIGQVGLRLVIDDLAAIGPSTRSDEDDTPGVGVALQQDLVVDRVTYRYPDSTHDVLDDITLRVPAGTSLAVVGASGAGKSTLIDIVLGLHRPLTGDIVVDGASVLDRMPAWQRSIGLVPQDVYVLDDTIAANVAFGVEAEQIDLDRVTRCLERAQLEDFVGSTAHGLGTRLGERGSRLSGGQRQRIGIARALYSQPQLLVLDEATSALDNETESKIGQTVADLGGHLTILVVAHRLSTVRYCDQIAYLEAGRVAALGTFESLREESAAFDRLVTLGELS